MKGSGREKSLAWKGPAQIPKQRFFSRNWEQATFTEICEAEDCLIPIFCICRSANYSLTILPTLTEFPSFNLTT